MYFARIQILVALLEYGLCELFTKSLHDVRNKSLDFVDMLREDLRTNNDDYLEESARTALSHSTVHLNPTPSPTASLSNDRFNYKTVSRSTNGLNIISFLKRRALRPDGSVGDKGDDGVNKDKKTFLSPGFQANRIKHGSSRKLERKNKVKYSTFQKNEGDVKQDTEVNANTVELGDNILESTTIKNKLQKILSFIQKERTNSKPPKATPLQLRADMLEDGKNGSNITPLHQHPATVKKLKRPSPQPMKVKVGEDAELLALAAVLREGLKPEKLTADQLDMAAAKGSRVHAKRIRNQLCHRHVLMPEGPKYDSRGSSYLPAFTPRGKWRYNVTKAPEMLLPRCCNCCRKSVLGCE